MRRWMTTLAAAALTAIPASPASAGEPRAHDGFFLRLSAGIGGMGATTDIEPGQELEISGGTGDVNFAIGGVVARNLALHATLWGWSSVDPDLELKGVGGGQFNGDLSLGALGIGLTYYFMPVNMYLSGSVGSGNMTLDLDSGPELESENGFVADFTLGKEWWTGDNWGLGLAASLGVYNVGTDGYDDVTGVSLGLRFSATLN